MRVCAESVGREAKLHLHFSPEPLLWSKKEKLHFSLLLLTLQQFLNDDSQCLNVYIDEKIALPGEGTQ